MISAAPPPPIVSAPPVSFGRVAVRVGPRTASLAVRRGGKIIARRAVPPGPRRVAVELPAGRFTGRIEALGPGGRSRSAILRLVVLPRRSRVAVPVPGRRDRRLQRDIQSLVDASPAISGAYVQHLASGCGAGVNAGAMFPAASTLKTALLVEAVRRARGRPSPSQAALLDRMIIPSDDAAANAVLAGIGDGNTFTGGARVTETLRRLGLARSSVRAGYILENQARIPVRTDRQPALYTNFVSTPFDLGRLLASVHRGAAGLGGIRKVGISRPAAGREVLGRLLRTADGSKIVAGLHPGVLTAHKSGYTEQVKHDSGIVYLPSGPVLVVAMSWSRGGVTDASGNRFIADVTRATVRRLAAGGRCGSR